MSEDLRIAVVVSTVGRDVAALDRLLESLERQEHPAAEIVVADQSGSHRVATMLAAWAGRLPVRRVVSTRGLSVGRNDAIRALGDDLHMVAVTDDDCTYEPGTLASAARVFRHTGCGVLCGALKSSQGDRVRSEDVPFALDRRTVWTHAIEPATFVGREVFEDVGLFDVALGVGSPGPWQSGEGTELLLRAMGAGHVLQYDGAVRVHECSQVLSDDERLSKARRYARGTGRVIRRHYGPLEQARVILRPLLAAGGHLLLGHRKEARRYLEVTKGRAEGVVGRTVGRGAR